MKKALLLIFCGLLLLPVKAVKAEEEGFDPIAVAKEYLGPTKELLSRQMKKIKGKLIGLLDQPRSRKTPRVVIDIPPPLAKVKPEIDQEPEPVPEPEVVISEETPEAETPPLENEEIREPDDSAPAQSDTENEDEGQSRLEESQETLISMSTPAPQPQPEEVAAVKANPRDVKILPPGKVKPEPKEIQRVSESSDKPETSPSVPAPDPIPVAVTVPDEPIVGEVVSTDGERLTSPWSPVVEISKNVSRAPSGSTLMLGQELALDQELDESKKKNCLKKHHGYVRFCMLEVKWPKIIEDIFKTSGAAHQDAHAVTRFDAKKLTHAHALFFSTGLDQVVAYLEARFGPPLEVLNRIVVPFEGRPKDNPTYIWRRGETIDGLKGNVTLEVRKHDDSRGAFPDMNHGLVRLYGDHSLPIFPRVSPRQMMLVKYNVN